MLDKDVRLEFDMPLIFRLARRYSTLESLDIGLSQHWSTLILEKVSDFNLLTVLSNEGSVHPSCRFRCSNNFSAIIINEDIPTVRDTGHWLSPTLVNLVDGLEISDQAPLE
ncbi:hypothetical protein Tco_1554543 [Tanacetum coccineum]